MKVHPDYSTNETNSRDIDLEIEEDSLLEANDSPSFVQKKSVLPETFEFVNSVVFYRIIRYFLFWQCVSCVSSKFPEPFTLWTTWVSFTLKFFSTLFINSYSVLEPLQMMFFGPQDTDMQNQEFSLIHPMVLSDYEPQIRLFLGLFFFAICVLTFMYCWNFHDYSNLSDIENWSFNYSKVWPVTKLPVLVVVLLPIVILPTILTSALLYATDDEKWEQNIESAAMTAVIGCLVFVALLAIGIGVMVFTSMSFSKFSGHNSKYSTKLVLKALIKLKTEVLLGILLLIGLPLVHLAAGGVIPIVQWNKETALWYQKDIVVHSPCYWLSFPPLFDNPPGYQLDSVRNSSIYKDNVRDDASQYSVIHPGEYFDTLSCDSIAGIVMFCLCSVVLFIIPAISIYLILSTTMQLHNGLKKSSHYENVKNALQRHMQSVNRLYISFSAFNINISKLRKEIIRLLTLPFSFCSFQLKLPKCKSKPGNKAIFLVQLELWLMRMTKSFQKDEQPTAYMKNESSKWRAEKSMKDLMKFTDTSLVKLEDEYVLSMACYSIDHDQQISSWDCVVDLSGFSWLIRLFKYNSHYGFCIIYCQALLICTFQSLTRFYFSVADSHTCLIALSGFILINLYVFDPFLNSTDSWVEWTMQLSLFSIFAAAIMYSFLEVTATKDHGLFLEAERENYLLYFLALSTRTILSESTVHDSESYEKVAALSPFVISWINLIISCLVAAVFCLQIWSLGGFQLLPNLVINSLKGLDDSVANAVFMRTMDDTNNIEKNLQLLLQWDRLVQQQRDNKLLVWTRPTPPNSLTLLEKLVTIKWAAIRNFDLLHLRSSLGLNILHSAMCYTSPVILTHLMKNYSKLLHERDIQNDTPIGIAMKELAHLVTEWGNYYSGSPLNYNEDMLLPSGGNLSHAMRRALKIKFAEVNAKLVVDEKTESENDEKLDDKKELKNMDVDKMLDLIHEHDDHGVYDDNSFDVSKIINAISLHKKNSVVQTRELLSRYLGIFSSNDLQEIRHGIEWDIDAFRKFSEISDKLTGRLAQHLAMCLNLNPPAGFSYISEWIVYNERIIQFLCEAYASTHESVIIHNCGLGDKAKTCMNIMIKTLCLRKSNFQSTGFSHIKDQTRFNVKYLSLANNRLTNSDAFIVADLLSRQNMLEELDLSNNLIEESGGSAIFLALPTLDSIVRLNMSNNIMGPSCSKDVAIALKGSKKLLWLNISHNRLGSKVIARHRLRTESTPSGLYDISMGLRSNRTLIFLDASYNKLCSLVDASARSALCLFLKHHPKLSVFEFCGNDIGDKLLESIFLSIMANPFQPLVRLGLAQNRLTEVSCFVIASYFRKCSQNLQITEELDDEDKLMSIPFHKSCLTSLDMSHNSLKTKGVKVLLQSLQNNMSLAQLLLSNTGFGPDGLRGIGNTLTDWGSVVDLDIGDNPLGNPSKLGSDPNCFGTSGTMSGTGRIFGHGVTVCSSSLLRLCMLAGSSTLPSNELLATVSAFRKASAVKFLDFTGCSMDGGCSLQLASLYTNAQIQLIDITNCRLGPRAGMSLISSLLTSQSTKNITTLHLSGNNMGPHCGVLLAKLLCSSSFRIRTLLIGNNCLTTAGMSAIAEALGLASSPLEVLDASQNDLDDTFGNELAENVRTMMREGKIVRQSKLTNINLSNNPRIGNHSSHRLVAAFSNSHIISLNLSNIGGGPLLAMACARGLSNPQVVWSHLDISCNSLSRQGVNKIFWSLRSNSSLEALDVSNCDIGPLLGTGLDEIEGFGTPLQAFLKSNFNLSKLSISGNNLCLPEVSFPGSSQFCTCVFDNYGIQYMSLRSNGITDETGGILISDRIRGDMQLLELDLGDNFLSWKSCRAIGLGLASNNCLKKLKLDNNRLADGGFRKTEVSIDDIDEYDHPDMALHLLSVSLSKNSSLEEIALDFNKLGSEFVVHLAASLTKNNTLQILTVCNNRLSEIAGSSLLNTMRDTTSGLQMVATSENEVGPVVFQEIAKVMDGKMPLSLFSTRNKVMLEIISSFLTNSLPNNDNEKEELEESELETEEMEAEEMQV